MATGIYPRTKEHKMNIGRTLKNKGIRPPIESQLKSGWKAPIGEAHPRWKGGRWKTSHGYINRKLYPDDFFYPMANSNGYVPEHRLVMAQYLNRCLLRWETVHHKGTKYPSGSTDNRQDNRTENLELLPSPYKHDALTRMRTYIVKLEREIDRLQGELEISKIRG